MIVYRIGSYLKPVGIVTDECPVCKRRRHFTVHRRKFWLDLYFIPLIPGLPTGYVIACQTCGMAIKRKPSDYPQLEKRWWGWRVVPGWTEPPPDEDGLAGDPLPDAPTPALAPLAAAVPTSGGAPTPEERLGLIREQFVRINIPLELRAKEPHFDKSSGIGCAAAFLLPAIPLAMAMQSTPGAMQTVLYYFAGALFAVLFCYAVWKMHTDVPRWFRREWLPLIALQLAPMNPTLEEFEQVITEFRQLKLRMGKVINPREVYEAVAALRDPASRVRDS